MRVDQLNFLVIGGNSLEIRVTTKLRFDFGTLRNSI